MKGDFSRIRFNGGENYTAVLDQQGRVALDADANEQRFIDAHRTRTETVDVIGRYGGPVDDAGFQVSVLSQTEIQIGPGRYYVNGLMCETDVFSYDDQPYLDAPGQTAAALIAGLNAAAGNSVIHMWLQVWQRLATALDDPCLREPALGQADTTARLQTVWRVIGELVPVSQTGNTCCQDMYTGPGTFPSTGTLTASTSGPATSCGCEPVAAAGYQGIENQLYRVEIHTGGDETQATFKWSRENGSVVAAITQVTGSVVTVSSLGPDANLGFAAGQWVELTDDTLEFGLVPNTPGTLYQIQSIQPTDMSVTLQVPAGQTITVDPARNARIRRWDQSGPSAAAAGMPVSFGTTLALENGIQARFGVGWYRSGDYWLIPARAATGQIEWPPCGGDGNQFQPPVSLELYRAPLACISYSPQELPLVQDCRELFSPLTTVGAASATQAIHVTGIGWDNDDVVTLDALITNGLAVMLDQKPTCPLTGANVIVTVEPVTEVASGQSANDVAPGQQATDLRSITVADAPISLVTVDGVNFQLRWQLPTLSQAQTNLIDDLNALLSQGASAQQWARMRIRIPGRFLFAVGATGTSYLDGQALGRPGVRADQTPRIDLLFPSGAGAAASDFEGWLYVAPLQTVTGVSVNYPAVTIKVSPSNQVLEVCLNEDGQLVPVIPEVGVTMSYPVLADTTVNLGVFDSAGNPQNIVGLPGSITVPAGQQSSAPIQISVLANPGAGQFTYTITAEAAVQSIAAVTQEVSFTVNGVTPPSSGLRREREGL